MQDKLWSPTSTGTRFQFFELGKEAIDEEKGKRSGHVPEGMAGENVVVGIAPDFRDVEPPNAPGNQESNDHGLEVKVVGLHRGLGK